MSVSYAQFESWVQDALNHLYDSPHLQEHPLAACLVERTANRVQRGQALRRILINGILSLSPEPRTPAQSPDWRAYRIMELHYIEGQSPQQVMRALGLGRTLYFKEKARMVGALAHMLWEQHQVQIAAQTEAQNVDGSSSAASDTAELNQVQVQLESLESAHVLAELQPMLELLAQAKGRTLVVAPGTVTVRADRVLLRQAILDVVGRSLELPDVAAVALSARDDPGEYGVWIQLRPAPSASPDQPPPALPPARPAEPPLKLTRALMHLMEGEVIFRAAEIGLVWPAASARPRRLLVIDDNVSLIHLFRRYLTGHPWQVEGVTHPNEAMSAIGADAPDVILLDVMLPRVDGWEVLRTLKSDARTQHIPVVICSVIHQPELATQLGAAGYLKKPVSQSHLLAVLTSLVELR